MTTNPTRTDVVAAIDVGGTEVKAALVGVDGVSVNRQPTVTPEHPWSLERLAGIATELIDQARARGLHPAILSVAVPGQVDDYHGVVQYSANLPWHDVAVADGLAAVLPVEVVVRHDVRAAALAEANLGSGVGVAMLFVAIGTGIAAAGAQGGVVVADHAGAGEIGQIKIRSGVGAGQRLEAFASARAIARRYADRTGRDPESVNAADVHACLESDPVARAVWDEAVDALADALEWSSTLFAPEVLVVGGGLVNAGEDLLVPLREGLLRRMGERAPQVRGAAFGPDAGWVGAALIGWRRLTWPIDRLAMALSAEMPADDASDP